MRDRIATTFGAEVEDGGVRFRLWAPSAERVELVVAGDARMLEAEQGGWRSALVPDAKAGTRYRYRIDGLEVPDPASRFQPDDVFGESCVVDPHAFAWSDASWRGRPWEEIVLYEAHVGTATPEGTFAALARRLPELAQLGVTAISLMPLAEFPGRRNWGYDGVLHYAPDASYGTPDDLRRLVDTAHGLGLAVVLDVVYNHFGPSGNFLAVYAKRFFTERHQTPWGAGLNFDGSDGIVREYFLRNALAWLGEYHVDGLRFDAVHAILDDSEAHVIGELATRIRTTFPDRHIHLILENEHNQARWLERDEAGRPLLHTAQWNDDIHHCWHVLLTGEAESYYRDFADDPVGRLARCLAEGFAYQGDASGNLGRRRGEPSGHLPPSAFVAFLQNHDQVGNRAAGDRLAAAPDRMALARACLLLGPQIPMLFMGEEWGASTPFQFFVDFADDADLSKAVREGRRREFEAFSAYGEEVPDPTAEATFKRSKLDHAEKTRAPHAGVLADTGRLLALRHRDIVPITKSAWREATRRDVGPQALDVTWHYAAGSIRMAVNFGPGRLAVVPDGQRVIWRSETAGGDGDEIVLPAWGGLVAIGEGA